MFLSHTVKCRLRQTVREKVFLNQTLREKMPLSQTVSEVAFKQNSTGLFFAGAQGVRKGIKNTYKHTSPCISTMFYDVLVHLADKGSCKEAERGEGLEGMGGQGKPSPHEGGSSGRSTEGRQI